MDASEFRAAIMSASVAWLFRTRGFDDLAADNSSPSAPENTMSEMKMLGSLHAISRDYTL